MAVLRRAGVGIAFMVTVAYTNMMRGLLSSSISSDGDKSEALLTLSQTMQTLVGDSQDEARHGFSPETLTYEKIVDEAVASPIKDQPVWVSTQSWRNTGLFDVDAAPSRRLERFPSIQERVKFYMSSWYAPPCSEGSKVSINQLVHADALNMEGTLFGVRGLEQDDLEHGTTSLMYVSTTPQSDRIFALDYEQLKTCAESGRKTGLEKHYCPELLHHVLPLWKKSKIPLLVQVGDSQKMILGEKNEPHNVKKFAYTSVPHLAKTRPAWDESTWKHAQELETACPRRKASDGRFDRIIWKLKRTRHFKDLDKVLELDSTPWEEKKDLAVFRGVPSGNDGSSTLSDTERCMMRPRCSLVSSHLNSTLVDAKFVHSPGVKDEYPAPYYVPEQSSKEELLKYKALIMLQGNDVSTGLKWAMLSSSVVLMPKPTISSWFMEELLQPYIHYIPIKPDMSDVEEKMRWVRKHDEKAQRIAVRGSLWVKDMLYHQDSANDEQAVFEEILARYRAHFHT